LAKDRSEYRQAAGAAAQGVSQHEFRRGGSRAGSGDSLSLQRLRLRRWEPNRFYHEKPFPAARDVGAAGQKLASTSLIFSAFLPAHEEYRRDFEVPEFRLSKAVIDQHRFDFELPRFAGFCRSGTAIQHVGL